MKDTIQLITIMVFLAGSQVDANERFLAAAINGDLIELQTLLDQIVSSGCRGTCESWCSR